MIVRIQDHSACSISSRGDYSRAASISFCTCSGAATICERRLFKSGVYSVIYGTCTCTPLHKLCIYEFPFVYIIHTHVHVHIGHVCTCINNCLSVCLYVFSSQDNNRVETTFGDCSARKRYSHIDLMYMIDGVEMQKATICAGNRCYYLKVS